MRLDYIDFDLSVDPREPGTYELSARSALAGEAAPRPHVRIDISAFARDLAALEGGLRARGAKPSGTRDLVPVDETSHAAARELGARLFDSVMVDSVVERYRVAREKAQDRQLGLRLRLRIQAPELAALPWEFMWDRREAAFVCSPQTTIVRHLEFDRQPGELQIQFPLRILGFVSGPSDQAPLNKRAEQERLHRALKDLQASGRVALTWLEDGAFAALQAALRQQEWHVLHYLGHGGIDPDTETGILALERQDGSSHLVSGEEFGQLLRGSPSLRLVVLNSCEGARSNAVNAFSSAAGALVRSGIPAVIAMLYPIGDQAAVEFAQAFYSALADAQPVDAAVSDARLQLRATNAESAEWGTPVIFMRPSSGVLFSTPRPRSPGHSGWGQKAWSTVAGGVAAPLIALSVLALSHASSAGVDVGLTTGFVGFHLGDARLPAASHAGQRLSGLSVDVDRLAADETVSEAYIPGDASHAPRTVAPDYLVVERRANTAQLTLDLTQVDLPDGTHVTLSDDEAPGQFLLTLAGAVPTLGVTMRGPVRVIVDGESRDYFYSTPEQRLIITPPVPSRTSGDSGIRLALRPSAVPTRLAFNAHVRSLSVMHNVESETGTSWRPVSELKSGSVSWGSSRETLKLSATDTVRFVEPTGVLGDAFLDTNGVRLTFSGSLGGLRRQDRRGSGNLMPTRLAVMRPPVAALLLAVMATAGAILVLAVAAGRRAKGRGV